MTRIRRAIPCLLVMLVACGGDAPELMLAQPDFPSFESQVYPVLLRDCGFNECHGSTERFFQVFGPGRERLDPLTDPVDTVTMNEVLQTYNRALSMVDVSDPARSLLLRKPLSLAVGGAGHEGVDSWMRNVYVSRQDPSFVILENWVKTAVPVVPASPQGATP